MALKKIEHYSINDHASIYDEEALTALELAGRTAAKVNEVVDSQNELIEDTDNKLVAQDKRLDAQDSKLDTFKDETIPETVAAEVEKNITDGTFDAAIDKYIGNLDNRLDEILENAGSVEVLDAEVIDARVGYDGTTYENAGNAIRGQVEALHGELADAGIKTDITLATYAGSYIDKNGDIMSSDNYVYSAPVSIPSGYTVKLTARGYLDRVAMISKYREGVYTPLTLSSDSTKKTYTYHVIEGGEYVFSFASEDGYKLEISTTLDLFGSGVKADIKADYPVNLSLVTGYYLNKSGDTVSNSGYCYTEPVHVPAGYTISFKARGYNTYVAMISKYVDGKYEYVVASTDSTKKTYTYTVSEGGEYVFSFALSDGYELTLKTDLSTIVEALEAKTNTVASGGSALIPVSVFRRIGVIGDSYASGELLVNGTLTDIYSSSWGQVLARKTGSTVINFSSGGMTTSSWLEKYRDKIYEEAACDLYIIALGINDANYDIGVGQFTSNLSSIVSLINDRAPHAVVVLSTMIANTSAKEAYNEALIGWARSEGGYPVIIQADDPFFASSAYLNYMKSSHPNAIGYAGMANAIERLLEKCIADNLDYFADICEYEVGEILAAGRYTMPPPCYSESFEATSANVAGSVEYVGDNYEFDQIDINQLESGMPYARVSFRISGEPVLDLEYYDMVSENRVAYVNIDNDTEVSNYFKTLFESFTDKN